MTISKPYAHGSRYRCKVRTAKGWRWCPSADSPEAAVRAAHGETSLDSQAQPAASRSSPRQNEDAHNFLIPEFDPTPSEKEALRQRDSAGAVRISRPFAQAGRWRCRLITSSGRQWAPMGATQQEARRLAERMARALAKQGSITIRSSVEVYIQTKRKAGWRSATLVAARSAVLAYCAGILDGPVSKITPHRAQQQYDRLQDRTSVATHRAYLSRTKSWARWLVSRGWLRTSPIEEVQGVGRRRRGKTQLSWDEGNRLGAACLQESSEGGTAVLMCLLMGLRASEVISRVVRDIDRGGTHLRIDDNLDLGFQTKTEKSKRPVKIPSRVRPLVANLAAGKSPTEPLFPGTAGGRKCRQWIWGEARRLCQKAGVPVVCPHSLRGWMATTAVAAGELPEVVAQALGHASSQITLGHYIAPGVAEAAQLERGQAAFADSNPTE